MTAAASWLDSHPEDYAYAVAGAVVAEEENYQIFHGQYPVWLRPHPNPSPEVIAIILRTIATQTAAQHPAHEWHTLHRWAREAHEYRQRPDVCSGHRTRIQGQSIGGNRQPPENLGARQLAYLRQQHRLANPPSKKAPRPKAPAAVQAQSPAAGLPLPQGPAAVTPLSDAEIFDRTRASTYGQDQPPHPSDQQQAATNAEYWWTNKDVARHADGNGHQRHRPLAASSSQGVSSGTPTPPQACLNDAAIAAAAQQEEVALQEMRSNGKRLPHASPICTGPTRSSTPDSLPTIPSQWP